MHATVATALSCVVYRERRVLYVVAASCSCSRSIDLLFDPYLERRFLLSSFDRRPSGAHSRFIVGSGGADLLPASFLKDTRAHAQAGRIGEPRAPIKLVHLKLKPTLAAQPYPPSPPADSCVRALQRVAERERYRPRVILIDGERRRVLAGGGDGGAERGGGGDGHAGEGGHGPGAGPAGAGDAAAAHRGALPGPHRVAPGGQVQAQDDAGDLRLPPRLRRARRRPAPVHDLRGAALHHGHLRHRLLQRRPGPHLPPRRRHALRDAPPPHGDGGRQARRHARLARRRHGAHLLQGRHGAHPPRPPPRPPVLSRGRGFGVEPAVDAGHGGHPGQLRVPLLLVPPPRPPRQEVPLRLLLQRLHVHLQLPPGRRRRPLRQAQPRRMAHHRQVPDPHRTIRRGGGVRRVLRAAHLVHREAGGRVRRRLRARGADHRLRHRLHRPPRVALPRKCAGFSAGDRWAVPAAVGQEEGGPATASKSSST